MFSSLFFLQEGDHRCNWAWGPITVQKVSRPEMRMHPPSEALHCGGGTFYEYFNSTLGSDCSGVRAASPEMSPKPFQTVSWFPK